MLYQAGDVTSDIYIVKDGSVEMRVNLNIPKKYAEFCPGNPTYSIPGVLFAVLSHSAVVNDIPELLQQCALDTIANTWLAHREECTAVAKELTTLLAIGKSTLLSEIKSTERLERISWFVKSCTSFRLHRVVAIQKAHEGMIYGNTIRHRKAEQQRPRKDICEVMMQFRNKKVWPPFKSSNMLVLFDRLVILSFQFASRQPAVHPKPRQLADEVAIQDKKTSDLKAQELAKQLPGRLNVVKLPRQLNRREINRNHQDQAGSISFPTTHLTTDPVTADVQQSSPLRLTLHNSPAVAAAIHHESLFSARNRILNAILSPRLEFARQREAFFEAGAKSVRGTVLSGAGHWRADFNPEIVATCQERNAGRAPSFRDPSFRASLSPRRRCANSISCTTLNSLILRKDIASAQILTIKLNSGC